MRKTQYYPLKGGINTETPALSVPPGQLLDALNYEPVTEGGYRRVDGFERFDGRDLASDTTYHTLPFDTGTNEPQIGITLKGAASFALGILVDLVVNSGGWLTNDATGYFVVVVASGEFLSGEEIIVHAPDAFSSGFASGFF